MQTKLAPYAVTEQNSKGRQHPSTPHQYRGEFDRDRDRIIHCQAFRRLEGKTQVFTPGTNDNHRTRLTHSIEVSQIGRTIAKALNLNENLTEAICLAHDIGHSPFGHCGEDTLKKLLACDGGFEHNAQALRIVDLLEHPYPDFPGLNLMYETRLGLAKHHSPYDAPKDSDFPELNPSLEGQIANIADRIAYNCHDYEDGLRSRLLDHQHFDNIQLVLHARIKTDAANIDDYVINRTRTAKAMMDTLVSDAIETSQNLMKSANIKTIDDVYQSPTLLINLSPEADKNLKQLEAFLLQNMYLCDDLKAAAKKIDASLTELFSSLTNNPQNMPTYYQAFIKTQGLNRTVADYIAGMTDRYCRQILKK
jgi:dGTPase